MEPVEVLPDLETLWQSNADGVTAVDGVYATIRQAIFLGRLKPNDRLPEAALARQFGISRTPVREALLRLEVERLVTRIPRLGLVVRSYSNQDMVNFFSVRSVLEGLAGREATERAQPREIAQLRWINQQLVDAAQRNDLEELDQLTQEFHQVIYTAARNSLLLQLMNQIDELILGFPGSTFSTPGWAQQVIAEHNDLIAAFESRRADEAEHLARAHKLHAREVRLKMLSSGATAR